MYINELGTKSRGGGPRNGGGVPRKDAQSPRRASVFFVRSSRKLSFFFPGFHFSPSIRAFSGSFRCECFYPINAYMFMKGTTFLIICRIKIFRVFAIVCYSAVCKGKCLEFSSILDQLSSILDCPESLIKFHLGFLVPSWIGFAIWHICKADFCSIFRFAGVPMYPEVRQGRLALSF